MQNLASSGYNQSEHPTTDGCNPEDSSTLQLWNRGMSMSLAWSAEIKVNILIGQQQIESNWPVLPRLRHILGRTKLVQNVQVTAKRKIKMCKWKIKISCSISWQSGILPEVDEKLYACSPWLGRWRKGGHGSNTLACTYTDHSTEQRVWQAPALSSWDSRPHGMWVHMWTWRKGSIGYRHMRVKLKTLRAEKRKEKPWLNRNLLGKKEA